MFLGLSDIFFRKECVMYKDLIDQLSAHFYPAIVFAAVLAAAAMQIERCGVKETVKRFDWKKTLFFLYTSFILFSALLGRSTITKPLNSLFKNFWPMERQEWENILIFVPISFLGLAAYRPKRRMRTAAALGFGLSLFIEVSQLISRLGQFQLSDLLFNTLGGVLGGALFCGVCALAGRIRKK